MAQRLSAPIAPKLINLHLSAAAQEAAILETAGALATHPQMGDFRVFCRELLEREAAGATHLGGGVVMPHARTGQVNQILIAAGRSETGVTFAGVPVPVRLIFVVAAPKSLIGEYLATVGMLARRLRDQACLDQLLACGNEQEFAKVFEE